MQSARIKSRLLKQYAYLSRFMMRAYYEEDEEVAKKIGLKMDALASSSIESILRRMDRSKFKDAVDIEQLVKIVLWCGEGGMKEKYYNTQLHISEIEAGYENMLDFFRLSCYKDRYQRRID